MKKHLWATGACALAFFVGLCLLDGSLFLAAHLPSLSGRLDPFLIFLVDIRRGLMWPKQMLRHLWLSESSPRVVGWALTILNLILWGALIHLARLLLEKLRHSRSLRS